MSTGSAIGIDDHMVGGIGGGVMLGRDIMGGGGGG